MQQKWAWGVMINLLEVTYRHLLYQNDIVHDKWLRIKANVKGAHSPKDKSTA